MPVPSARLVDAFVAFAYASVMPLLIFACAFALPLMLAFVFGRQNDADGAVAVSNQVLPGCYSWG